MPNKFFVLKTTQILFLRQFFTTPKYKFEKQSLNARVKGEHWTNETFTLEHDIFYMNFHLSSLFCEFLIKISFFPPYKGAKNRPQNKNLKVN
jgi:hypothetical protein